MARFDPPGRAAYTPAQQAFYERYATGPRAAPDQPFRLIDDSGALIGPPSVWVTSPEIGLALAGIGYQMRWGLDLSDRAREAVILAVGYAYDSPFELYAHEPAARAAGWTDDDLRVIREGGDPDSADDEVRTALHVARRLLAAPALDAAEYAGAAEFFGVERLFQLVTLIGYYRLVATQLAVFDIQPPQARGGRE
jgi:alkylhydroperoxidase family enzyme